MPTAAHDQFLAAVSDTDDVMADDVSAEAILVSRAQQATAAADAALVAGRNLREATEKEMIGASVAIARGHLTPAAAQTALLWGTGRPTTTTRLDLAEAAADIPGATVAALSSMALPREHARLGGPDLASVVRNHFGTTATLTDAPHPFWAAVEVDGFGVGYVVSWHGVRGDI